MDYLRRSAKTGAYSYRRRVPDDLRPQVGKSEWKVSLKTKDKADAMLRCARLNKEIERTIAALRRTPPEDRTLVARQASDMLKAYGVHPEQAPFLKAVYSPEEREAFEEARLEWLARTDNFMGMVIDEITERIEPDGQGGWKTVYRSDPFWNEAINIAVGEKPTSLVPTFSEAVEVYIATNTEKKSRDPVADHKFRTGVRTLAEKFKQHIGDDRLQVQRADARRFLEGLRRDGLSEASVGRYASTLTAIFHTARREFELDITNPFEGLRNNSKEKKTSDQRRPFSPEELQDYVEALKSLPNPNMGLIGLVMVYTGCRTGEAAGLSTNDIKLETTTPHIIFRPNDLRPLDKGQLSRSVPLVEPLLSLLKDHTPTAQAFFGKYGPKASHGNVSAQLSKVVRNRLQIKDPLLVPYSTRHTFKDRGRAAGIRTDRLDYLQGHSTSLSSAVALRYGHGIPPSELVEDMTRLLQTTQWGHD